MIVFNLLASDKKDTLLLGYDDLITRKWLDDDGPKVYYSRSDDCWVVPVDKHTVELSYNG